MRGAWAEGTWGRAFRTPSATMCAATYGRIPTMWYARKFCARAHVPSAHAPRTPTPAPTSETTYRGSSTRRRNQQYPMAEGPSVRHTTLMRVSLAISGVWTAYMPCSRL